MSQGTTTVKGISEDLSRGIGSRGDIILDRGDNGGLPSIKAGLVGPFPTPDEGE